MKPALTPTKIAVASRCLHTWHLECVGDQSEKIEPDAGIRLIRERGLEREREIVSRLRGVVEPKWDGKNWPAGYRSTRRLMGQGKPWIYQAVLMDKGVFGVPDLLKRARGASALGKFTYMPIDIKGHKDVIKKDRYQLHSYTRLLESVLGYRPRSGGIWLNTDEVEQVDLSKDVVEFEALLDKMESVRRGRLETRAYRCGECGRCPWIEHCRGEWEREERTCLLYGVTGTTARKLDAAGFGTWRAVAKSTPDDLACGLKIKQAAATDLWLHARAFYTGGPQIRNRARFPKGIPLHFFDIETHDDTVYLHGDVRVFGGKREEKQFVAKKPEQEGKAWTDFLDYLARDKKAIVYCWTTYERGFVEKLWKKYGGNPQGWKHLRENLVDQCAFVKEHFALPVSSYSIKKVAPLFGFSWAAEDAGGLNSESWYGDWLETGDRATLKKILRYNLDDVVAMEVIHKALQKVH